MISPDEKIWVDDLWDKIVSKMEKVAVRSYDKLPYIAAHGVHDDKKEKSVNWWTNGFFAGMLWHLYADTKIETFRKTAEHSEKLLDKAFEKYEALHHDVGFLWHLTAGADYKLTGSREAFLRAGYAASMLASRFEANGEYIRAWNGKAYSIIDTMMNLNLLYWASDAVKAPRFQTIAMAHADMTMKNHIRPDGSVIHIVVHDPVTGEPVDVLPGQGLSETSSWSRGQAWAVYGFTLAYIHTGKQEYLDTAKKVAHYFIAAVCDDYLPRCDFRTPEEPVVYDSTAGAIAACGLIELSRIVPEYEKKLYLRPALKLLQTMAEHFLDLNEDTDPLLLMGTENYNDGQKNVPIIYGDFFFVEALYKLRDNSILFW